MIPSYGKIYNIGHRAVTKLFSDEVVIQEKVDGSYFAFGLINGKLHCRSKGKQLDLDAPDKMFALGVAAVSGLQLIPGFVYCGEYLQRPKHNALAYGRVPVQHVILFDILVSAGSEEYLNSEALAIEADRLGLEVVPTLRLEEGEVLEHLLSRESILGGCNIEGVVVKNYHLFDTDGHILRGKFVNPSFRELNDRNWKDLHPGSNDIKMKLEARFKTEARWAKAVQHLRESGHLTNEPKDIASLIHEVHRDVLEECKEEVQDMLFKWAEKDLMRAVTRGLPEWYKGKLNEEP